MNILILHGHGNVSGGACRALEVNHGWPGCRGSDQGRRTMPGQG